VCFTPFTRYNRLSIRLYNRFDNRLYRVNKHPTGCQTGCQNRFDNRVERTALFVQPVVKPSCTPVWQPAVYTIQPVAGLTTGSMFVHTTTGCETGLTTGLTNCCIVYTNFNRLSNRFENRFHNRLYLVDGAFVCLSVSNFAQKLMNGFALNFQVRMAMGQWTNY